MEKFVKELKKAFRNQIRYIRKMLDNFLFVIKLLKLLIDDTLYSSLIIGSEPTL